MLSVAERPRWMPFSFRRKTTCAAGNFKKEIHTTQHHPQSALDWRALSFRPQFVRVEMLQNKNLIWSDVCIWLKIFTAQTSSMQFRDSRSLSRSILNLQSLVREVLFKDVTLGPFHGGQEQRQVRSILDRHAHRWVIPISNSNFVSPKKNRSLVKFLGFKRLNLMFRLGKLDMRHPSWVGNQFILSGPNLCWQILGVKMLFEATSTTQWDTKRRP